jgi:hypothetical protein
MVVSLLSVNSFAGQSNDDGSNTLVVGIKTNSVEGHGKFGVLKISGDTVFAVSRTNEILPGLYIITACSKNEIYHKKLYVIDSDVAKSLEMKPSADMLAMVIGVTDFENYAKLQINLLEPNYLFATDPSLTFDPGTYLIVGTSNQEIYHQKLVINH